MRDRTHDLAKGKWKGILLQLGMESKFLTGRSGPCPMCGEGKDRFTWDNRNGDGTWICRAGHGGQQAGDAWSLLKHWRGWDFKTAASEVDKVLGRVTTTDPATPQPEDQTRRAIELWNTAEKLSRDDLVCQYLALRGVPLPERKGVLRYHDSCPIVGPGQSRAMLAAIQAPDGTIVSIHRTFLKADATKANLEVQKAVLGPIPDGSAIRLAHPTDTLGVAEGIETALAASRRFSIPVWSLINAGNMMKFVPPEGVKSLVICSDCDTSYTGQAAAYSLARRLWSVKDRLGLVSVTVAVPPRLGTDWADTQEELAA